MDCLFCRLIKREIPTSIIFEDPEIFVFNDIKPQAPFHLLVIPKKHIATINDVDTTDELLMGKMILTAKKIAKDQGFCEKGYRLIFNVNEHGGQEIFHIHLHILGGRPMHWPPG
jgi:histidine triad (HIT) family protein